MVQNNICQVLEEEKISSVKDQLFQMIYDDYITALKKGNRQHAVSIARQALEEGIDVRDLYVEVFQPAMHEIGRLWETNQLTVAQEHLATAITQSVMAQLYSYISLCPDRKSVV